LLVFSGLKW